MFEVWFKDIKLAKSVRIANSFFSRLVGLMFINKMEGYDGLLIKPGNSMHTFFMKFNIDIIFLNNDYKIIKIIRNMSPWKMTWIYFRATQALELKGGTITNDLKEGDYLIFKEGLCIS